MAPVEPALDACQLFSGFREEINSRLSRMNAWKCDNNCKRASLLLRNYDARFLTRKRNDMIDTELKTEFKMKNHLTLKPKAR